MIIGEISYQRSNADPEPDRFVKVAGSQTNAENPEKNKHLKNVKFISVIQEISKIKTKEDFCFFILLM